MLVQELYSQAAGRRHFVCLIICIQCVEASAQRRFLRDAEVRVDLETDELLMELDIDTT